MILNRETYQQFSDDMLGMRELNILLFLRNSCTVSIIPKSYYNQYEIPHKCQKIPSPNYMVMHRGNGGINVYFWIMILLMIQHVAFQVQLIVCYTKAIAVILFGKETCNQ